MKDFNRCVGVRLLGLIGVLTTSACSTSGGARARDTTAAGKPTLIGARVPTLSLEAIAINGKPLGDHPKTQINASPGDIITAEVYIRDWSPDGEWIVYYDTETETLVRTAISGGGSLTLVDEDTINTFWPHWGEDGTVVSGGPNGLFMVPAAGGPVTKLADGWGRPATNPANCRHNHDHEAGGHERPAGCTDARHDPHPRDREHPRRPRPGIHHGRRLQLRGRGILGDSVPFAVQALEGTRHEAGGDA